MYLTATQAIVKPAFDPLDWWRDNLSKFPCVGQLRESAECINYIHTK